MVGECVIKTPERIHHFGFSMDGANREYFRRPPRMAPQAAGRGRRREGRADRAVHLRLLCRPAQRARQTRPRRSWSRAEGTIGLVTAAAAIGMGARVIVVDPVPLRRDIAKRLGADATVDPSAGDPDEAVQELTQAAGPTLSSRRRAIPPRLRASSTTRARRAGSRWSASTSATRSRSNSARSR